MTTTKQTVPPEQREQVRTNASTANGTDADRETVSAATEEEDRKAKKKAKKEKKKAQAAEAEQAARMAGAPDWAQKMSDDLKKGFKKAKKQAEVLKNVADTCANLNQRSHEQWARGNDAQKDARAENLREEAAGTGFGGTVYKAVHSKTGTYVTAGAVTGVVIGGAVVAGQWAWNKYVG